MQSREGYEQIPQHPRTLASLTREKEGDLSGRTSGQEHPLGIGLGGTRRIELRAQIVGIARNSLVFQNLGGSRAQTTFAHGAPLLRDGHSAENIRTA